MTTTIETPKFDTFDSIEYTPLRIFNRTIMMLNIKETFGNDVFQEYVMQFSEADRQKMLLTHYYIQYHGREATLKEVTKNMPLSEEDGVIHDYFDI